MSQGSLPVQVTDQFQWGQVKDKFAELASVFVAELRKTEQSVWKVAVSALTIFLLGVATGWIIFHPKTTPGTQTIVNESEKPTNVVNSADEPTKLVMIQNQTNNCEVLVVETDARGVVRRSHADLKVVGDSHGIGVNPGMPKIILKVRVIDADGNMKYESSLHTFRFDPVNRDKKEKYIWSVGDTDPPDAVKKEL